MSTKPGILQLEKAVGYEFFDYQLEALEGVIGQNNMEARACLYYKTGAGKSITALGMVWLMGHDDAVVITPPSTNAQWEELGQKIGVKVQCMSHAKFRQASVKLDRKVAVIADEFHLFGGHKGQGWKKLDRLAAGLQAPLILASATPNYNDAERVYCVQHVLDASSARGGYIEWLYNHCVTSHNPFGMEPIVERFRNYGSAADALAALPGVFYLPDDVQYQISPEPIPRAHTHTLDKFGYDMVNHKMVASQMEERHLKAYQNVVLPNGELRNVVQDRLSDAVYITKGPVLLYANHSTIAERVYHWAKRAGHVTELVTGKTSTKAKAEIIARFNRGKIRVLVGTASLATGTDGMDKVCDHMIIVDDTDDDALRRQLIGRIMPRGSATNASAKLIRRFEFI